MNLVESVDWLFDMGLYDQPPMPTTEDETLSPLDEEDAESSTTKKPK